MLITLQTHQTIFIKFPIIHTAIRTEPVSGIMVQLVLGNPTCNAIAVKGPKLFDEPQR